MVVTSEFSFLQYKPPQRMEAISRLPFESQGNAAHWHFCLSKLRKNEELDKRLSSTYFV